MLNGRLFNDKLGEFTCFANNGTSLVDFLIASTICLHILRILE